MSVAQAVSVNTFIDARSCCESFHHHANVGVGHWVATKGAEHRFSTAQFQSRPYIQPSFDHCCSAGVQADRARSSAFSVQYAHAAVIQFEIFGIERESFVDPQTGSIEQRDQLSVAQTSWRTAPAHSHECADLGVVRTSGGNRRLGPIRAITFVFTFMCHLVSSLSYALQVKRNSLVPRRATSCKYVTPWRKCTYRGASGVVGMARQW